MAVSAQESDFIHISAEAGDLSRSFAGNQQTATAVFDVDMDGTEDFLIAERTRAPAVVWYQPDKIKF